MKKRILFLSLIVVFAFAATAHSASRQLFNFWQQQSTTAGTATGWYSLIVVNNTTGSSITPTITFYNSIGTSVGSTIPTIADGKTLNVTSAAVVSSTAYYSGFVRILGVSTANSSGKNATARGYIYNATSAAGFYMPSEDY